MKKKVELRIALAKEREAKGIIEAEKWYVYSDEIELSLIEKSIEDLDRQIHSQEYNY